MNIVILDGHVLNPGDLSWDGFASLGDLSVYGSTSTEDVIERSKTADALIINKVKLGEKEFDALPKLKYIGITATGYNIVDIESAHWHGITVTNVPEYSTDGVAETVFSYILAFSRRVKEHSDLVKTGEWESCGHFSFWKYPLTELRGKRIGIIGMGSIGMRVAEIASAFGMDVVYTSRSDKPLADEKGYHSVELDKLLATSDYISIHTPLTDETKNLIDERELRMMKENAVLINTARGGIVNEEALYKALSEKWIEGAALDVISEEPPKKHLPLFDLDNIIITPHIAWTAKETRTRLINAALENLVSFTLGIRKNVI